MEKECKAEIQRLKKILEETTDAMEAEAATQMKDEAEVLEMDSKAAKILGISYS